MTVTDEGNGRSIQDRALHAVPEDQIGMFDRVVEDVDLERMLEEREQKRGHKADVAAEYKVADDNVKARLVQEALEPGDVIRCGRFRIKMTRTAGGTMVQFETSGSDRLFITPLE